MDTRFSKRLRRFLQYATIIAICIYALFPFYWMINTSLQLETELYTPTPKFLPVPPFLRNYSEVFKHRAILKWITNTTLVGLTTSSLAAVLAFFSGYSLSRFRFRGRGAFGAVLLITQMIPGVLLVVPIYIMFLQLHLLDRLLALVIAFTTFTMPASVWMIKGYVDSLPVELEDAARIDGCDTLGVIFRITLPLAVPIIIATTMYTFLLCWNNYLWPRTLIDTPDNWVVSLGMSSFIGQYELPWCEIMAAATILALPAVLLYLLLQRYLLHGLTAGALKG